MGGFGFAPHLTDNFTINTPPFGNSSIKGLKYMGHKFDIIYSDNMLNIYKDNKEMENNSTY